MMFIDPKTAEKDTTDGRLHEWHCRPGTGPTENLIFVKVTIPPGGGHPFHRHPNKEEVIYILSGEAEQWVGEEMRKIGAGHSAYIEQGMVHATYNRGTALLEFIAVITPCSAEGPVTEDVSGEMPWRDLGVP